MTDPDVDRRVSLVSQQGIFSSRARRRGEDGDERSQERGRGAGAPARRRNLTSFAPADRPVAIPGQLPGCGHSLPRDRGPVTDHFDGARFRNPGEEPRGFGDFLLWQLDRDRALWRAWTDAEPGPPPPERVRRGELRVTFVNHATVLLTDGRPQHPHRPGPVRPCRPRLLGRAAAPPSPRDPVRGPPADRPGPRRPRPRRPSRPADPAPAGRLARAADPRPPRQHGVPATGGHRRIRGPGLVGSRRPRRPRRFMLPVHIDPAEAVRAHEVLGAASSVAIHFGTFAQGDDGQTEPVEALRTALLLRDPASRPRFRVLREGEGGDVPPLAPGPR